MNILVVGTGAREHAICNVVKGADVYSVMSNKNPGISRLSKFQISSEKDLNGVKKFALENKIDIAIIGPEAPLEMGIVDELQKAGIDCVGPTKAAARIETDKAFMRDLFETYKIDGSIVYKVFDNIEDTNEFIDRLDQDIVIKPVGLTGGKGVKIVGEHLEDGQAAKSYVKEIIENKISGHAQVVIEEKLIGEEFTIQAFVDGDKILPMPAAQDHPHAYEGDQGPITGGMGSYSDKNGLLPFLNKKDYDKSVKIMGDTIKAVKNEVGPYKGILYGQFMLCKDGPKLVEYNARFGDPEAMNVLPLLKTDFVSLCEGIIDGNLKNANFENKASVCKYIVPKGYPESGKAGQIIEVNEQKIADVSAQIYYAAVNQKENKIYTSASRALGIVGIGDTIEEAEEICENATKYVKGDVYHRRDVGTADLIRRRVDHMDRIRKYE
jgi:phosphoribosylamine---glycine ligase